MPIPALDYDKIKRMLRSGVAADTYNALELLFVDLLPKHTARHIVQILHLSESFRSPQDPEKERKRYYSELFEHILKEEGAETLGATAEAMGKLLHLSNMAESLVLLHHIHTGVFQDELFVALRQCAAHHVPADMVQSWLENLCISPVLTSHPTEPHAKGFVQAVQATLASLSDFLVADKDDPALFEQVISAIERLVHADATDLKRLNPEDEIAISLSYLSTMFHAIPALYRDVQSALDQIDAYRGIRMTDIPARLVKFRNWSGFDADGNRKITSDVTHTSIKLHKNCIKSLYINEIDKIIKSIDEKNARAKTSFLSLREQLLNLADGDLPASVTEDLTALCKQHHEITPVCHDLALQLRMCGNYLSKGDLRQKAGVTNLIVDTLLSLDSDGQPQDESPDGTPTLLGLSGRIYEKYVALSDIIENIALHADGSLLEEKRTLEDEIDTLQQQRADMLTAFMEQPPGDPEAYCQTLLTLTEKNGPFSEEHLNPHAETIRRLALIQKHPEMFENWIISNCECVADILSVQFLLHCATINVTPADHHIHIIPLYESRHSLQQADTITESLLENEWYVKHQIEPLGCINAMIGYSDSTKEAGPAARKLQLDAPVAIAKKVQSFNQGRLRNEALPIQLRMLHGHGSAIPRGGGPWRQYHTVPPEAISEQVRLGLLPPEGWELLFSGELANTVQGRARRFRVSTPANFIRYTKGMLAAGIHAAYTAHHIRAPITPSKNAAANYTKQQAAITSCCRLAMDAYRQFMDMPAVITLYQDTTNWRSRLLADVASRSKSYKADTTANEDILFSEKPLEPQSDNINEQRAIGFDRANAHARKFLPGWYGFHVLEQFSLSEQQMMASDSRFSEMVQRVLVALAMTDFSISWRYLQKPVPSDDQLQAMHIEFSRRFSHWNGDEDSREQAITTSLAHLHLMRNRTAFIAYKLLTGKSLKQFDKPEALLANWPALQEELLQRHQLLEPLSVLQADLHVIYGDCAIGRPAKKLFAETYAANNAGLTTPVWFRFDPHSVR